ncbi:MAG: hypothetical protein K0R39_28 [Symbiobacteriaceae bacterium]|jgi:hypothetical protein|nr:hypothetical protein [Symbiobacteriaceae bacterium]
MAREAETIVSRKWVAIMALLVTVLSQTAAGAALGPGLGPAKAISPNLPAPAKGALTDADQVKGTPFQGIAGEVGIAGYTPGDSGAESDEEFVLDSDPALDTYTFRSGGPLVFPITIDRYFGPVDANGHLLHPENIEGEAALLTLRVWDVDQNSGTAEYAPEVDEVYFNDQLVGTLSGADYQWSTFTVSVPVSQLKFPDLVGGTAGSADNWVEIFIDTANVGNCECWAVEVDWARLVVKGIRPTVLVHGFKSDASTWNAWETNYAPNAGLPVYTLSFANNNGSWLDHADELGQHIDAAKQMFGVDKLNIVGHSKGGLDSRAMLALSGRTDILRLVMLGTPNGGSPLADIALVGGMMGGPVITTLIDGIGNPALTELTPGYMAIGNLLVGRNPATQYFTVAGNWNDTLLVDGNPLIWGQDDGVVAVSSVETLSYTTNLGRTTSFHTSMTSGAGEWALAQGQVVTTFGVGSKPVAKAAAGVGNPYLSYLSTHAINMGDTATHEIVAQAGVPVTFGILWGSGALTLAAASPTGAPLAHGVGGVTISTAEDDLTGLTYSVVRVEAPEAGAYRLTVASAEPGSVDYLVLAAEEAPPSLTAAMRSSVVGAGTGAVVEATLDWQGQTPAPVQAEARILRPDGTVDTITLADDGTGEDAVAGDGTYTGIYTPSADGFHYVAVVATGTAPGSALRRFASSGFAVTSQADKLGTVTGHRGVDTDGDGLFNYLEADISTAVTTPGAYQVAARLTDAGGHTLALAGTSANLGAGPGTVQLRFDGTLLGESGFTGDLSVVDAALIRSDGGLADFRSGPWTLSGYSAGQFLQQAIHVLPGIADQALDTDGDGLYDRLDVTLQVEVDLPGWYDVNARLVDSTEAEIVWAWEMPELSAGVNTIVLHFDGGAIRGNGRNGPYHVRDFSLYPQATGKGINIYDLHTTAPYDASQFVEPPPVDFEPPVWPPGAALTVSNVTSTSLTLSWPAATDNLGITHYYIMQDYNDVYVVDGTVHSYTVTGLTNNTSYQFIVLAEDVVGNLTIGPQVTATTRTPTGSGVAFVAPLDAAGPVTHPADKVLPIQFQWLVDGVPTLDTSVSVRVRDGSGRLVAGYTYGAGIAYDQALGQYLQAFDPALYGLGPGAQLRIQVYFGGKLRATAYVNLE